MNYKNLYPNLALIGTDSNNIADVRIDWNAMMDQGTYWEDAPLRLDLIRFATDKLQAAVLNGSAEVSDMYFDGDLCVSEVIGLAGLPDMYDNGLLADVLDMARRTVLLANGYVSPEEHRKRELQKLLHAEIEKGNLNAAQKIVKILKHEE